MIPSSLGSVPPRDFLVKRGVEIHLIPMDPVACTFTRDA